jgi:dTDP-4-amino-4,6-dideoxygalactose transaminase
VTLPARQAEIAALLARITGAAPMPIWIWAAGAAAALGVLRGGRYVGGDVVDAFLADLSAATGWTAAAGAASGTDALSLALMAAGLRPGDEVLLPAVSFFATAGAALRLGLRPVPVDVGAGLPLLDPAAVAEALGPRVRALVQVPLFGLPLAPLPAGLLPCRGELF